MSNLLERLQKAPLNICVESDIKGPNRLEGTYRLYVPTQLTQWPKCYHLLAHAIIAQYAKMPFPPAHLAVASILWLAAVSS